VGRARNAWLRSLVALLAVVLLAGCATTMTEEDKKQIELAAATRDVGVDHLSQGRTAMAIRKLQQARDLDPKAPQTYLWLGEAYRRKGLLERAEENLLIAIDLTDDPTNASQQETRLNLSALYIQMKRYPESIELCDVLIKDPTFSSPWRPLTNRGWSYYKLGDMVQARQSFDDAIDFHPSYWPAHMNLGILEQKEGHSLKAIHHFEKALEKDRMGYDATAEANYRVGEIYVAMGQRKKAIEHFSVALERSPHGEWGTQSQSYLDMLR
jgi:Tfp pilus assembly protein PilF